VKEAAAARAAPVTECIKHEVERCESLSVYVKSGTAPKRAISMVRKVRVVQPVVRSGRRNHGLLSPVTRGPLQRTICRWRQGFLSSPV